MVKLIFFILFNCLLSISLEATHLKPWHGMIYDIHMNGSCLLQEFQKIDTGSGIVKRTEFDAFYELSTLMVVKEEVTAEIELSALNSRHPVFGLQSLRLTGRYFWLNDIVADPVSLTTGLTLFKIFAAARRNIATFDHGGIGCEGHVSIGKELSSCEEFWLSRIWGVLGLGISDIGYPSIRLDFSWERNWWERHQLEVFVKSIWGLGNKNLYLHSFKGYGSVNYHAIDIGLNYRFRLNNNALFKLDYAFRAYGHNCPIEVNTLLLEVEYPFKL